MSRAPPNAVPDIALNITEPYITTEHMTILSLNHKHVKQGLRYIV